MSDADELEDDSMSESTTSTAERYRYTNDLLAGLLVASTVGAVAYSVATTGSLPGKLGAVFAFESLLACGWAFGKETLGAVADVVPSPYGGDRRRQPARSRREAVSDAQSGTGSE